MDAALYKGFTTSRSLTYHCYVAPAQLGGSKPTLLFLHGFPSTSHDWRHQIPFFERKGYGLIVPDMLGYGGTAKPANAEAYRPSLIVKDIVDILDAEKIQKAIVVAHDW
jgi:pimeloyl-ACP methyl ester carboxylesterase